MTPAQKLTIEAKQAVRGIDQLTTWVDRNKSMVGACELGLKDALELMLLRYDRVQQALEVPPAIAVLSESRALSAQLIAALTEPEATEGESRPTNDHSEILRRLFIRAENRKFSAALRYETDRQQSIPPEYPFRSALLNMADLAAIFVRVHQHYGISRPDNDTADRYERIKADVARRVQPATVPGLTESDIRLLRDTLERLYPDAPRLRLLAAAGFWAELAVVAAHISDHDRITVLSLLWGEQPELTAMFGLLVNSLATLGYASEVYCVREALIEHDAATGWFILHPDSIVDASTLHQLGTRRDSSVRLIGRYGHTTHLQRAVMAALTAEVAIAAPSMALTRSCPADVLELPLLPLPPDLENVDFSDTSVPARTDVSSAHMRRVFAHMKAQHLIDRANRRHGVTTLLACVDTAAANDDVLPDILADWIEHAQGGAPHERERIRTGLFVVKAAAAGQNEASQETSSRRYEAEAGAGRMELADALARKRDWLAEWTPGQPFDNAFELPSQSPFAEPRHNASGNGSHMPEKERAALPSRTIAASSNIELSGRTELARLAASTATHLSRTPASACHATQQLLEGVASVTQSAAKQRALRRAMGQCSMRVRARLLRFRPDAVPGDLEDWREQVAVLLERRLVRVARNRKLGLLLSSLALHEVELETIFRNSDYAALERRTSPAPPPVVDVTPSAGAGSHERHPPVPRALSVALAERAVGYWLSAMRRAARSDRLCREIGISPWMLEHLVDEVGMGGLRLGLVRHVAEVIEAQVIRRHQGARTFAKVVGTVLHGFLQKLNVEISDNARGAAASYAESQQRTARERVASRSEGEALPNFADQWCKRLRSFIADNMAAAPYWSSSTSNDDLARLLSEFSSSPIEVEL